MYSSKATEGCTPSKMRKLMKKWDKKRTNQRRETKGER
jgi:hypothetical protein